MAYTKAQLEGLKNTLIASNQPILASQHREQIQSIIDEMFDSQTRANVLVGVQADSNQGSSDTFLIFRSGEAYQIPLNLLSATTLASLGDVLIASLTDGDTLVYNSVDDRWENQNIFLGFSIANLQDVNLSSLTNGDILRYNSSTGEWDNTSLATILSDYALLTDLNAYQLLSQKGQANGYAQLDSGAKIPTSIIPDSVLGQVEYEGTWNASTNTPTLPATPLKKGDYYVVSADGTQFGIDFLVGDWIISNGTIWEKVDNTDAVTSVFGRLGNIVANASDYSAFYVTLDTAQTITGFKTFSSTIFANDGVRLEQAGSSSRTRLVNLGSTFITASGTNQFGFNSSNNIYFAGSNKFGGQLAWNNTANRTYTLQDASGTIALTSDLHNPVTLGTANGLSLTGQVLSLGLASGSTNGALSSTDWNTFNNKFNTPSGTTLQYIRGDGSLATLNTSVVPESGSLYFTEARVRASVLTGYTVGSNTALAATDSILSAFGKVQAQINAKQNALTNPVTGTGSNGQVSFWTGAGTQSGDGGLFWDNTNKRLRVGQTSNNNVAFQVAGSGLASDNNIISGVTTENVFISQPSNFVGSIFHTFNPLNGDAYIINGNSGSSIVFGTRSAPNNFERWRISNTGILQSNGAQTIQTSTGNLTLATAAGNGNILLSSHGTGKVGVGTTNPLSKLEVIGNASIGFTADAAVAAPTNGLIVNGIVGIGINNPATSAILDLTSTTRALLITRMTTAQRDAMTAFQNGMILYNTTLKKFQGYEDGAWANLI